jgi:hypothetical protein
MDIFGENVEMLSRDLLIIKYNDMKNYAKYLQAKINEYEKNYNVETLIRQKTPSLRYCSSINKVDEIEVVRIPERKFWVYKPYVREAEEIINQYMRGE